MSERPVIHQRLYACLILTGLLSCCALLSGCQKNLLRNVQKTYASILKKETKKIPKELEGLHAYLSQDLWVRNDHWSAFKEWKTQQDKISDTPVSSMGVQRWMFGPLEKQKVISEPIKKETPVASQETVDLSSQEENKTTQNSQPEPNQLRENEPVDPEYWSVNMLQDFFTRTSSPTSTDDSASVRPQGKFAALKAISEWNSPAGWNAAILWGTLEPATALKTLPILEKVIFDAPTRAVNVPQNNPDKKIVNLERRVEGNFPNQKTGKSKSEPELPPLSPAMKHAAINAMCLVLSQADAIPFKTKNRLTQLLERPDISIELRGELYRGLARFVPPAKIPTLNQAFDIGDNTTLPPKILRRSALDACIIHGLWYYAKQDQFSHPGYSLEKYSDFKTTVWPENMMQVRWDSDPTMRWNFGFWVALVHHPDAITILTSQLRDADLKVQNKAIEFMGILGTETALELLKQQSKRLQESSRISAAIGLTPWGAHYLAPLIGDKSSSVRRAVAKGLGQTDSPEAALLLRSLMRDRSSEVQLAVVQSISHWPDELAIPLLLEGIQEGVYKTRRDSVLQLTDRIGSSGAISIEAPRSERIVAVRELIQTEKLPGGLWDQLIKQGLQDPREQDKRRIAEIQSYFQDILNHPRQSAEYHQAYQELLSISAEELSILEKMVLETSIQIPKEIYSDLLPQLNPSYVALNRLASVHLSDRRKAAQQLLQNSQHVSLSPIIVKRLRKIMAQEQDRLVWRIVMSSIAKDNYEEAAQLALLAINHNWPDIRILGCEYFGTYGLPQYAIWLLPLLNDKNESVQLTAINAIGQCHNPIAITGTQNSSPEHGPGPSLRSLLTHSNQRIRFQTVVALSRLGNVQGMQELVRLSNHTLISMRTDAIREMGNSRQTRFVEPLIQSAWTERNHIVMKEILISLEKLVPPSEQPAELSSSKKHSEQAEIWMNWWQSQHSQSASRLFTGR
ncbi:HEAT repeat domain-containing protein [Gimesia aquarii]|uniref:HEAT repeat domain-containing protein n=1 Tax=Gimesia aquarii TaxID=2527964 RepID=UPI0018D69DBD|nr:HEAT repeat domain-containing protein [Gimesia aquarii]